MKISVIIPTKNRHNLLKRAINSVLNQNCESVLEIVVINDASNDDTSNYLKNLKLPNFIYYSFKNSVGGGAARNKGLELAHGDFIAFLDDDDEWLPTKIAAQEKLLSKYSFVGTRINSISSSPNKLMLYLKNIYDIIYPLKGFKASFNDVYLHKHGISPSSAIMERDNLIRIGGYNNELKANQGRELFIRYSLNFETPYVIRRRLVNQYQNHLDRISSDFNQRIQAHQILHDKYSQYVDRASINYDQVIISLMRAKSVTEKELKRQHLKNALRNVTIKNFIPLIKVFLIYLITK